MEKTCSKCGDIANGSNSWCRKCNSEYSREYRKRNADKIKASNKRSWKKHHTKNKYGITPEEYDRLLTIHGKGCGLCGRTSDKPLHLDHDHKTGKLRSFLCSQCNHGLGLFGDSVPVLQLAIRYLNYHNG